MRCPGETTNEAGGRSGGVPPHAKHWKHDRYAPNAAVTGRGKRCEPAVRSTAKLGARRPSQTREDGEIETETGRDFLVLTRSLLRPGIAWGSHLDSAQAATLDSPLHQPRGLGLFDEVADVGDTSGVTLRDNHCHEDDPEAVLQHTKAGEP